MPVSRIRWSNGEGCTSCDGCESYFLISRYGGETAGLYITLREQVRVARSGCGGGISVVFFFFLLYSGNIVKLSIYFRFYVLSDATFKHVKPRK